MNISNHKPAKVRRLNRVRAQVKQSIYPRLSVFRANKHLSAQIIDDKKGVTLVGASTITIKDKMTKSQKAKVLGEKIAKLAAAKKVGQVVFDRGSYRYQGRIKVFAESARGAGLKF
jgi:large subunit ribosomal protein L18